MRLWEQPIEAAFLLVCPSWSGRGLTGTLSPALLHCAARTRSTAARATSILPASSPTLRCTSSQPSQRYASNRCQIPGNLLLPGATSHCVGLVLTVGVAPSPPGHAFFPPAERRHLQLHRCRGLGVRCAALPFPENAYVHCLLQWFQSPPLPSRCRCGISRQRWCRHDCWVRALRQRSMPLHQFDSGHYWISCPVFV